MATMTSSVTAWLNRLLRGELAAVETYQQALDKMKDAPEATELQALLADHQNTVNVLRKNIHERGDTPGTSSGAWGAWAKFVEGTAKMIGNTLALEALRAGELHGIKEYERAVEDGDIDTECRSLIRNDILPQTRSHIGVLDRLIDFQ